MTQHSHICITCAAAYPPSERPPEVCIICADERQYVGAGGQQWTTLAELRKDHTTDWRELEPGLFGIGAWPAIAIGQRALFIPQPGGGVMWDCTPLITDDALARIKAAGGVRAMAISHPHFHANMVDWSEALGGVPIHIHAGNADSVVRPDQAISYWSDETLDLGQGITLARCGGHFTGSAVLHWAAGAAGKGALFASDTITVVPDTRWMSFMRSYPNLVPLNERTVRHIASVVEPFAFDRVYAGWWDRVCKSDAKARLAASVERYVAAIR
jgi:hypothetical protein